MNSGVYDMGMVPRNMYNTLELQGVRYVKDEGSWYDFVLCKRPVKRLVLKDVSMEVRSGEVMCVMGSAGSGKTFLLNAVGMKGSGLLSGRIAINGTPCTEKYFNNNGAYVFYDNRLMPLLTVNETLKYSADLYFGGRMSGKKKSEKVKWAMVELDLVHVEDDIIKNLTESERRRLIIALQIIKDPLVLLVEEPMTGLDSFSANSVVSLLSRFAKKYFRIVIFTAHRPQSDIFPLLDRVTYLCAGEVVFTGYTKNMLEYFHGIGHPCPEFENPLDFYLTLSSLDRRTPARLIETTTNVERLIDKFRQFGGLHQTYTGDRREDIYRMDSQQNRVPLSAWGHPWILPKIFTLTRRATWHLIRDWQHLSVRLLQLPLFMVILFLFVFELQHNQAGVQTRLGMMFYCLAGTSFLSCMTTAFHFAFHRNTYCQEGRDKLYGGFTFVVSQMIYNLLPNLIATFGASAIIYWATRMAMDGVLYVKFAAVMWCVWSFIEVQTIALMLFIADSYIAFEVSTFITIIAMVAGSGFVRPINALPDYIYYPSYASIYRYAGYVIANDEFQTMGNTTCDAEDRIRGLCRFPSGENLMDTFWPVDNQTLIDSFGVMFIMYACLCIVTLLIYNVPIRKQTKN